MAPVVQLDFTTFKVTGVEPPSCTIHHALQGVCEPWERDRSQPARSKPPPRSRSTPGAGGHLSCYVTPNVYELRSDPVSGSGPLRPRLSRFKSSKACSCIE